MSHTSDIIHEAERLLSMGYVPFLAGFDKKPLVESWKAVTVENAMTQIKLGLLSNPRANLAVVIPRTVRPIFDNSRRTDGTLSPLSSVPSR